MKNKNLICILLKSINIIGLIFLFFAPISVIIFSYKERNFSIVLWWILLYLAGLLISLLSYRKYVRHVLLAFAIVYSISTVAVNFIYNDLERHNGIPFYGSDDITYHNNALEAVGDGIDGFDDAIYYFFKQKGHNDGSYYYTAFIATIYNHFQKIGFKIHSVIPRYFNSLFLGLLGLIVFAFGNLISLSLNAAKVAGYSASLWPLLLYHSAIIRRDTIFAFFLLLSIYLISLFLDNKKNIKVLRLLILASSVLIVSLLRSGFFSIYILLFILIFFSYYKNIIIKVLYRVKLIHFVIVIFFLLLIFKLNIIPDFMVANRKEFSAQFVDYITRRGSSSEHGIGSSIFRLPLIFSIPLRLIYASIAPVPSPTYLSYNIRWLGTIPWFICLPILLRTLIFSIKTKDNSFLSIKFLSYSFLVYYIIINIVSFTETQQTMYVPLGILLIFYGVENQKTSLKSIYSVNGMIILSIILFILYIILKLLIVIIVK